MAPRPTAARRSAGSRVSAALAGIFVTTAELASEAAATRSRYVTATPVIRWLENVDNP
ncbi:hypothetical protein KO481_12290 [Nocardia sp. NEAU-G5]|uniref:Uncharacterized protein n=1 Tax=Nocardia albiluteola TaxID=2842303 RepID=A0ABS6AWN0_9NOCA|nr:hypothetical protein [Nocardia albiluteola]MBU3062303.1 hypothetical protein [Nocardia albiluteola]